METLHCIVKNMFFYVTDSSALLNSLDPHSWHLISAVVVHGDRIPMCSPQDVAEQELHVFGACVVELSDVEYVPNSHALHFPTSSYVHCEDT